MHATVRPAEGAHVGQDSITYTENLTALRDKGKAQSITTWANFKLSHDEEHDYQISAPDPIWSNTLVCRMDWQGDLNIKGILYPPEKGGPFTVTLNYHIKLDTSNH